MITALTVAIAANHATSGTEGGPAAAGADVVGACAATFPPAEPGASVAPAEPCASVPGVMVGASVADSAPWSVSSVMRGVCPYRHASAVVRRVPGDTAGYGAAAAACGVPRGDTSSVWQRRPWLSEDLDRSRRPGPRSLHTTPDSPSRGTSEEALIRHEIDEALAALVGLRLRSTSRVVDMATFGFGVLRAAARVDAMDPAPAVADYRLHVQELWRIVRDGRIAAGYADYFYPPTGSGMPRGAFVAREAVRTRRDDLLDAWMSHDGADHVVASAHGTDAGDLAIAFADGCLLETFVSAATSDPEGGSDEHWRLIPPRLTGEERSLIVTAHGIER